MLGSKCKGGGSLGVRPHATMQSRLNWKKDLSGRAAFDTRGKRETCGVERVYNGKCRGCVRCGAHIVKVVALIQLTYLPTCFVFSKKDFVFVILIIGKTDSQQWGVWLDKV